MASERLGPDPGTWCGPCPRLWISAEAASDALFDNWVCDGILLSGFENGLCTYE